MDSFIVMYTQAWTAVIRLCRIETEARAEAEPEAEAEERAEAEAVS